MREAITIQIPRPNFGSMSDKERKAMIALISTQVAEQIVFQEEMRKKSEEIAYWQQKMIEWQVEDKINEMKHGNKVD